MAADIQEIIEDIKDLMRLGSTHLLGVDIGLSSVKVVEMVKSGNTYELLKFSLIPLPEATFIEDEIQRQEDLASAVAEAIKEVGSQTRNVCVGLWGPNTHARRLQLAGGTAQEVSDQVLWESEQYIPFDIDDSIVSYDVMGDNEGGGVDVLIAAARIGLVEKFKDIMKGCNQRVRVFDMNGIALSNIFELVKIEGDAARRSWLILDIGAQKTTFVLYRQMQLAFIKEINIAGVTITEELQRQGGYNFDDAEALKSKEGGVGEEIAIVIESVLGRLYAEIKKTLDFLQTTYTDLTITECVLTGGSAQLPGLTEGLSDLLSARVTVFDPFEKIKCSSSVSSEMKRLAAERGAVALGLAMRTLDQ